MRLYAMVLFLWPLLAVAGDEVEVSRAEVPAAVLQAVAARHPQGRLLRFFREGVTTFEVQLTRGGDLVELIVEADGTIVEEETPVTPAALPEAIRAALKGAKVVKAERAVRLKTQTVTFEVVVDDAGREKELKFDAKGRPLVR